MSETEQPSVEDLDRIQIEQAAARATHASGWS